MTASRHGRTAHQIRHEHFFTIAWRILLFVFTVVWLSPLYWLLNTAFKYKKEIQSALPVWIPTPIYFGNIIWLLNNVDYGAVERSIIAVASTIAATLVLAPPIAYALSRFRGRANKHIEIWIITTRMMPAAALIVPYYVIFRHLGLLNTGIGLVILYISINLPLMTWILLAYLRVLPEDAEEAALIDGCSRWGAFWFVVLPAMRAGIVAACLLIVILTWNEFFVAFVILSSNITFPVQVASFLSTGMNPEYGHMAAAGLMLSLPTIVLAVIFHRHLISGLSAFAGYK